MSEPGEALTEHEDDAVDVPSRTGEIIAAAEPSDIDYTAAGGAGAPFVRAEPTYVYALGRVEPRFPTAAIEKELAQVAGRADVAGLTDRQALQALLSERPNRYLARQLCWVFSIQGLDTYILHPRDPLDTDLLLEALRPEPRPTDVDVVIGALGGIAPPDVCNGLMVPVVVFDQLYSFDLDSLVKSIPRPDKIKAADFEATAQEILLRIMQLADNAGATNDQRALNYLSVRYPAIYELAADRFAANDTLSAVDVRPSRLSSTRRIVDVVFSYTNRQTDVTGKHFLRVDVTEEFPFLVTKLSPYFDR